MRIILTEQDILDIVNSVYGINSAGFDKKGNIIIDEVVEKLDKNHDSEFDYNFKPYKKNNQYFMPPPRDPTLFKTTNTSNWKGITDYLKPKKRGNK